MTDPPNLKDVLKLLQEASLSKDHSSPQSAEPSPDEGLRLIKAFMKVENRTIRAAIIKLVESISMDR